MSLRGWTSTSEENYRIIHKNCLLNGASDVTELSICIDRTTKVIDEDGCFLVPRAIYQYNTIFDFEPQEIENIVRECYQTSLEGENENYHQFYQCIQGA